MSRLTLLLLGWSKSIRPHTYGHMNSYDIDVTVSKQPEAEIKGSSLKEPVCWHFSKHKFQNKSWEMHLKARRQPRLITSIISAQDWAARRNWKHEPQLWFLNAETLYYRLFGNWLSNWLITNENEGLTKADEGNVFLPQADVDTVNKGPTNVNIVILC